MLALRTDTDKRIAISLFANLNCKLKWRRRFIYLLLPGLARACVGRIFWDLGCHRKLLDQNSNSVRAPEEQLCSPPGAISALRQLTSPAGNISIPHVQQHGRNRPPPPPSKYFCDLTADSPTLSRALPHTVTPSHVERHTSHVSTPVRPAQPLSLSPSLPQVHYVIMCHSSQLSSRLSKPDSPSSHQSPATACISDQPDTPPTLSANAPVKEGRLIAGTDKMTIIILSLYIYLILTQKTWLMFRMQVNII